MSIGKRLIDLARSELNSLLDKAADYDERRHLDDDDWGHDLRGMSDKELEAEIERRKRAREEAEEAATGKKPDDPPRASSSARPEPPRRTWRSASPNRTSSSRSRRAGDSGRARRVVKPRPRRGKMIISN